jgi:hypothetical protein
VLREAAFLVLLFVVAFVLTLALYVAATEIYPWVNYAVCYLRLLADIPGCLVPIPW